MEVYSTHGEVAIAPVTYTSGPSTCLYDDGIFCSATIVESHHYWDTTVALHKTLSTKECLVQSTIVPQQLWQSPTLPSPTPSYKV